MDGAVGVPGGAGTGMRATVGRAALLILAATLFGRILGLVRDQTVAYFFQATDTDAFFLAYKIPYLVALSAAAAMTATFIPVFTQRYVTGRKEEAWGLSISLLNLTGLVLIGVVAITVPLAPWLIPLVGPGFGADTSARAVDLFRILMPLVVFTGLAGLAAGILNSLKRFGLPAFSTSLGALVTIVFIVTSHDQWGVTGLAVGTTVGAAVSFFVLWPQLHRGGLRYRPSIRWDDPGLRDVAGMIWPVLLGSAVGKVSIFADQVLGSFLESGSISALNYSEKLFQLPLGLFVAGITVPLFPLLSEHVAAREPERLKTTLSFGLRMIAFVMVPASAGLIVLRTPIVTLLFQHGEFGAEDTTRTAWALLFYSFGLFSYAGRDTLTRVFYAYHDTRTPVKISMVAVVLNIAVSYVLMQFLGVGGLALGTSIALTVNFIVLIELLRRKIGPMGFGALARSSARIAAAAAVMTVEVVLFDRWLAGVVQAGDAGLGLRVALGIGGGAVTYFIAARVGRLPELPEVVSMLKAAAGRRGKRSS
ncbi:MAG: murein biosynthesis integral membrane protein MurJ [Thermoleophilia bacterium]